MGHKHKPTSQPQQDDPHRELLCEILCLIKALAQQGERIMATLDQVLVSVKQESDLDDSIIALLNGIEQQLKDALAGATLPAAVQAKVDAVFDQAEANKTKLTAAIVANTPAASVPPTA